MGVRFLPRAKKMRNPNFFWNWTSFRYCPCGFFESRPLKSENTYKIGITSARCAMLVLICIVFQRGRQWWSLISLIRWQVQKLLSCVVWRFAWATMIGCVWIQMLMKHWPNEKAGMWAKWYITDVENQKCWRRKSGRRIRPSPRILSTQVHLYRNIIH